MARTASRELLRTRGEQELGVVRTGNHVGLQRDSNMFFGFVVDDIAERLDVGALRSVSLDHVVRVDLGMALAQMPEEVVPAVLRLARALADEPHLPAAARQLFAGTAFGWPAAGSGTRSASKMFTCTEVRFA